MSIIFIALRLIHILAGTFWVGAAVVTTAFLMPAARAIGPEGGKFIQFVLGKLRMSNYISLSAILTTLSGIVFYWIVSGGLRSAWIFTLSGSIFSIGAITGIAAAILGGMVTAPTAARMEALSKEMQSMSGTPKPEQLAKLQELQKRLGQAGLWGTILLVVTAVTMAIG
ncbi:MAG: hypothetical protein HOP27_06290 [Anaerolineales bacterium]|nr:hypothetical protein [Anaerolineales bacterium]